MRLKSEIIQSKTKINLKLCTWMQGLEKGMDGQE